MKARGKKIVTYRPIRRQYLKAMQLAAKAPLVEPAIRKLERDREGLQKRAALARQLAHQAQISSDAAEAQLQQNTAETHEAQIAAVDEQIAKLQVRK
jgi:phage shock protein A